MNYIITIYPTLYRRYLIKDVNTIDEAWIKYCDELPEPIDEDYIDYVDNEAEIELLTPELQIQYGLEYITEIRWE